MTKAKKSAISRLENLRRDNRVVRRSLGERFSRQCDQISRPIGSERQNPEKIMKTNVLIERQRIEAKTQPPDLQRRLNAGWLKLWKAVYPGTRLPHNVRGSRFADHGSENQRPAAVDYLDSLLGVWLALALLATGCAGPRPLKGGKAVTTRKPAGVIEQTLVQGENPSQATTQNQESVKVRTYTLPAGSRINALESRGRAHKELIMQPLSPVRTRSTASLTSPAVLGTRWNTSLPEDTLARATSLALPATRAWSQQQQTTKKESK